MTPSTRDSDDQAVRDRALAIDGSFIVQAPAGSGKTELLIQRYLNLLGHVDEPEEIVAITFTRKAAGEMRERIVAALRRADTGASGTGGVEARRLALARRVVANDRRRGWELVSHPARLQIQTIDALCLSLSRRLPYLSGFAAPSGILEDAGAAYRRAAVDAIRLLGAGNAEWRDVLRRFLVHVDNDMARATGLLSAMLATRDQWLRYLGDDRMARGNLESAWRRVVDAYLTRVDAAFPAALKAPLAECADAAARQRLEAGDAPEARAWLDGEGFPAPGVDQLPRWRFMADLLVTQSAPQWRRQVNRNQGFLPKTEAKQVMQELLASLAGDMGLPGMLYTVKSLPEPGLEVEQARVLDAMVSVLKLGVAQLQVIFAETGQVDFVEVTQRANRALGALEAPTDLALMLDYRIQHLLVDEFQDTSVTQRELIELLTQGWTPGDGRTLFLVGDPMQSIYRFRQADVGVFLGIREHGLATVPVEALRLHSNFRSAPGVVEWVNRAFSDCFPPVSDSASGAVAYAPSIPQRPAPEDEAGVHVHPFVDCAAPRWADELAVLIGQALARSGDVAVLVRARSHLKPLLPALQARGIPYSGLDIAALINQPAVRDLYSLTRALIHPGDRMAWLALLRAPWCGLLLADLVVLGEKPPAVVWTALHDPERLARMSERGRERVDRFRTALAGAMAQRGRLPLRHWVRRAWVSLDGPALIEPSELRHVQTYFDLLGRYQSGMNLADENAFDEALRSHWANVEARAGAVQLMTVHRAKGLEFDEVFLPALESVPRGEDRQLLLWEEPADGQGLLLAAMSARGAGEDPHYRYLRALQAEKAEHEDVRLLYVACTRARERLHLLGNVSTRDGHVTAPRKGSLLQRIWSAVEPRFLAAAAGAAETGDDGVERQATEPGQPLRRVPSGWSAPDWPDALPVAAPIPVDEQRVEFSWAGETARHIGILVHELIQRIAAEGLARWSTERVAAAMPDWRDRLHHIGVPAGELDGAVRRVADSVRNLLADDTAVWLLDGDHQRTADEYELSVRDGGRVRRLRVDRTFVDGAGVRWIVDYKTSAHEGGERERFLDEEVRRYRARMESYARAFRAMEEREIRLGLYFPLLRAWRGWVYGN